MGTITLLEHAEEIIRLKEGKFLKERVWKEVLDILIAKGYTPTTEVVPVVKGNKQWYKVTLKEQA